MIAISLSKQRRLSNIAAQHGIHPKTVIHIAVRWILQADETLIEGLVEEARHLEGIAGTIRRPGTGLPTGLEILL